MLNLQQKHDQNEWSVGFNSMYFADLFVTCSAIKYFDLASHVKAKLDMAFAGSCFGL